MLCCLGYVAYCWQILWRTPQVQFSQEDGIPKEVIHIIEEMQPSLRKKRPPFNLRLAFLMLHHPIEAEPLEISVHWLSKH